MPGPDFESGAPGPGPWDGTPPGEGWYQQGDPTNPGSGGDGEGVASSDAEPPAEASESDGWDDLTLDEQMAALLGESASERPPTQRRWSRGIGVRDALGNRSVTGQARIDMGLPQPRRLGQGGPEIREERQ
jgi:hypothetical protein